MAEDSITPAAAAVASMAGGAAKAAAAPVSGSLDAYEVVDVIGKGSFGTVARIKRKADGRMLVWKELNYGHMREKEKQLVVSEVNILRELRHPFIVRYYDRIIDKASTRLYIVMEYAEGGDLGALIKRHRKDGTSIEEDFVWHVFTQCIVALKECHRHTCPTTGRVTPILHRDIKPGNIFMDAHSNIKIGDFGLAKELQSESKFAYTNVGTPFYMSPEMINDMRYNEKSDIWALGCLLYELCALAPPFDAANHLSLAVKINAGKFNRIPAKYSEDLHRVIRWMLHLESTKRPSIEELEKIPRVKSMMPSAQAVVREYQANASMASKMRELKAKEEELAKREAAIAAAERSLREREAALAARLAEVQRREAAVSSRAGTLADDEARRYSMGDRLRPASASSTSSASGIPTAPPVPGLFRAHSSGDVLSAPAGTAPSDNPALRRARSMSTGVAMPPPIYIPQSASADSSISSIDTPGSAPVSAPAASSHTAMDVDHVEVPVPTAPRPFGFAPAPNIPLYSRPSTAAGAENPSIAGGVAAAKAMPVQVPPMSVGLSLMAQRLGV